MYYSRHNNPHGAKKWHSAGQQHGFHGLPRNYLTTHLCITAATTIVTEPRSDTVPVNSTAFMACRASYDTNLDMIYIWKKNNRIIDPKKEPHYRVVSQKIYCTWEVKPS